MTEIEMIRRITLGNVDTRFDFARLAKIVQSKEKYFDKFGEVIQTFDGPIVYKDNGAKILAVAHIDTVVSKPRFNGAFYVDSRIARSWQRFNPISPCRATPKKKRGRKKKKIVPFLKQEDSTFVVAASGLDDRLGVFIILELLPQMGVECDYILTTNEERGMSTARGFQTYIADRFKKKYNWFVEFDRRGEDCVTYRYKTNQLEKALEYAKFNIGTGSYTDICDMHEHGVCGINIGVGYKDAHSIDSWFSISELYRQLDKFKTFYDKYKDTRFTIDTSKWYKRQPRVYQTNVEQNRGGQPHRHTEFTQRDNKDWGKELEYVWFSCPYCRTTHNLIKKGDIVYCECGNEYRRSIDSGDIYRFNRAIGKYYFCLRISKNMESFPLTHHVWKECGLCTNYNDPRKMIVADGKRICAKCVDTSYSECAWCEKMFFSLGLDELTLCEDCNETLFLYGKAY